MSQTKPDVKALKFLLTKNWHRTGYNLQILKSKYKAMHKVPNVIEKPCRHSNFIKPEIHFGNKISRVITSPASNTVRKNSTTKIYS